MTKGHYKVIWFSGDGRQAFYATAGGKDLSGLSAAVEKAKSFVK